MKPPGEFRLLSFDCYGTLIDWETGITSALRPILERYGVTVDDEEILELHARLEPAEQNTAYRSYREVLREVALGFGREFDFVPDDSECNSFADSVANWPAFPDSAAALARLSERYLLAIISNIDDDLIRHSIAKLGVEFDYVITAEQARAYKPNLRVFRDAYQMMDIPHSAVLHVAQSLYHDIAPASELGVQTVWVNRRKGKPGSGATPEADARPGVEVTSLAELADMVESEKF